MVGPMKLVLVISSLLFVPISVSAQVDHTHTPGPGEDCTKLSKEFQTIMSKMDGPGSRIEASPKPESTPALEPGIHKLEVALLPLSEVRIVGKESRSEQTMGAEGTMANQTGASENRDSLFGGFVLPTVPRDGLYRISTDSTLWIEVIERGKPIERGKTTPRLHCGRIHKSLVFPLKRERSYWLEIVRQ